MIIMFLWYLKVVWKQVLNISFINKTYFDYCNFILIILLAKNSQIQLIIINQTSFKIIFFLKILYNLNYKQYLFQKNFKFIFFLLYFTIIFD